MTLSSRPTTEDDFLELEALKQRVRSTEGTCGVAADVPISALLAHACLALTAISSHDGSVRGAIMLFPQSPLAALTPDAPDARELDAFVNSKAKSKGVALPSGLLVPFYVIDPEHEEEVLLSLLLAVFELCPSVSHLMLVAEAELPLSQPYVLAHFVDARAAHGSSRLYVCARDAVRPPLSIRQAVVEDNDDLEPVVAAAARHFGSLGAVPESGDSACPLAALLAAQDERNITLVAESSEGAAVGLMAVTCDVDTTEVLKSFELDAFDNLMPPEQYDALRSEVEQLLTAAKLAAATARAAELQAEADEQAQARAEADAILRDMAAAAPDAESPEAEQAQAAGPPVIQIEPEPVTEAEIQAAVIELALERGPVPTNCMAMTMLCMADGWHASAQELVRAAFAALPERDWIVVTLPYDEGMPLAMRRFECVRSKATSKFAQCLYLLHREALSQLKVRLASELDQEGVLALVQGVAQEAAHVAAFQAALEAKMACVATFNDEVVALVAFQDAFSLAQACKSFSVSEVLSVSRFGAKAHVSLEAFVINPVFHTHMREVLLQSLVSCGKECAFYGLRSTEGGACIAMEVMQQVPRAQEHASDCPDLSLFVFAPRHAYTHKLRVGCRIVVVGASTCGLAAIQQLLLSRDYECVNITLLAPDGEAGAPALSDPSLAHVLDGRVAVVDASVVRLDREAKQVELSDGNLLPYDLLVLTPGLQDQTLQSIRCSGVEGVISVPELAAHFRSNDASDLRNMLVYGHTLAAYEGLAVLEERGVDVAGSVTHLAPPRAPAPIVAFMHQVASRAGLNLPKPISALLTRLEATADAEIFTCFFDVEQDNEEPGKMQTDSNLLLAADEPDVSQTMFSIVNDSGLVYDGRVVVDHRLRTLGDPCILAGGTVAKFSRAIGGQQMAPFHSMEVGQALAGAVLLAASEMLAIEPPAPDLARAEAGQPPQFQMGSKHSCKLPGGNRFCFAGTPSAAACPQLSAGKGATVIATTSEQGYCHILVEQSGLISMVAYAGPSKVMTADRLSTLVNLPCTLLSDSLKADVESGALPCLAAFLAQPWLEAVLQPKFARLLESLTSALAEETQTSGDKLGHSRQMKLALMDAQDAVIKFVSDHATELPVYVHV